jgi:hypothetical protein
LSATRAIPRYRISTALALASVLGSLAPARIGRPAPAATTPAPGVGNFYVSAEGSDSNDGSRNHPWATISHAGLAAVPGSTIHVAPGVYREAVATAASGTREARIIYVSDQKWKAVIEPMSRAVFTWKNTGNYTDIIGFEIGGKLCGGIGLGGSFQRAISNNSHNSAEGCNNSDGGSGISDFNYASQGNDILGNYVHDVGIGDPSCGPPKHNFIQGIYQANAGGHVDHNIAANNCGWGIHLWHAATRAVITYNTVVSNRAGGILIGSGDAPCTTTGCPGGNDYTIVQNNIIAFNGGWGLHESGQDPGQTGVHNVYSYNLLYRNQEGDVLLSHNLACLDCLFGRDPEFVSAATGDYTLKSDSPALGSGKALGKSEMADSVPGESKGAPLSRPDLGAVPRSDPAR